MDIITELLKANEALIVVNMHKKFEVNRTKIKGGCQSYTKAAPQQIGEIPGTWKPLSTPEFRRSIEDSGGNPKER